jgi:hypothetical protein
VFNHSIFLVLIAVLCVGLHTDSRPFNVKFANEGPIIEPCGNPELSLAILNSVELKLNDFS